MGIAFKSARARSSLALQGGLGSGARHLLSECLLSEDDAKLLKGLSRDAEEDSQFKTFIASYVASKVNNCLKRPSSFKVCDNVFLAGQLSEDEIREFATKEGCKSVLNLRQLVSIFESPLSYSKYLRALTFENCCQDEAGQFGLGMLAKEKEVVEAMGLKYINVPVPREGTYDIELCQKVSNALMELLASASPVLVHCRSGWLICYYSFLGWFCYFFSWAGYHVLFLCLSTADEVI